MLGCRERREFVATVQLADPARWHFSNPVTSSTFWPLVRAELVRKRRRSVSWLCSGGCEGAGYRRAGRRKWRRREPVRGSVASSAGGLDSGGWIVLGVDRPTATALAAAAGGGAFGRNSANRLAGAVAQFVTNRAGVRSLRLCQPPWLPSLLPQPWPFASCTRFIGTDGNRNTTTAAVMRNVMMALSIRLKSKVCSPMVRTPGLAPTKKPVRIVA